MSRRAVDARLKRPEAGARRGGVRKEERWTGFQSRLAPEIQQFIAAKRAFGRKYVTDERMLRLFDTFLAEHDIARPDDVTPALVDEFLASRPAGTLYFNCLRRIVHRLMRWLVGQGKLKRCDFTGRRISGLSKGGRSRAGGGEVHIERVGRSRCAAAWLRIDVSAASNRGDSPGDRESIS